MEKTAKFQRTVELTNNKCEPRNGVLPSAGSQRFTRGDHFDLLEKRIFLFSIFLLFLFFYLVLFFEMIHEPLSLEEGTLAEDDSQQIQAYLVLDIREEVRQAP